MNKKKTNFLLMIDNQKDFCDPTGALFVQGAVEDSKRTAQFIANNANDIDGLGATFDSHDVLDISHPSFWNKADGSPVDPFTPITLADIDSGAIVPSRDPKRLRDYVADLEDKGEFGHFIWPEHCIVGSTGWALQDDIYNAIKDWQKSTGRYYQKVTKGTNPYTEHFGAFRANVPRQDDPSTQANTRFLKTLVEYENIYLCGQARDYCVANTLKQALEITPELAPKIIVLEDCMSNVNASTEVMDRAQQIYDEAKAAGVRFMKSTDVQMQQMATA